MISRGAGESLMKTLTADGLKGRREAAQGTRDLVSEAVHPVYARVYMRLILLAANVVNEFGDAITPPAEARALNVFGAQSMKRPSHGDIRPCLMLMSQLLWHAVVTR